MEYMMEQSPARIGAILILCNIYLNKVHDTESFWQAKNHMVQEIVRILWKQRVHYPLHRILTPSVIFPV
jgi:hypothetical protein